MATLRDHMHTLGRRGAWLLVALLIALVVALAGLQMCLQTRPVPGPRDVSWGVTFSQKQCADLGVDWRRAYSAVVGDLRPSALRLVAYWDLVEPARGTYDFRDLDWQVAEAERAGIPVTIAVGQKVPRWPEYHFPAWLDVSDTTAREAQLLQYEAEVVRRYAGRPGLRYWQVENEPFLGFGVGPGTTPAFLGREIALVHQLDRRHPVLVTDGGEYGGWVPAARQADVFGTTLYRRVYDQRVGTFTFPLVPAYYALRARLTRLLVSRPRERFICAELGAEPWGDKPVPQMSMREQSDIFSAEDMSATIAFARRTGFREFYLWGVEWWYCRRLRGDDSYWAEAKAVIRSGAGR